MRKSVIATFIVTLSLVAAVILSACSPDRPAKDTRTAVPSDMPGARNSSAFAPPPSAIEISQPLPGTVVTNTVTVLATGQRGSAAYHVDLLTNGRTIAQANVTPSPNAASAVFSVTLQFEPVTEAVDGELTVYAGSGDAISDEPDAVVPLRLAPASMKVISGPAIRLRPDRGKAGTPVVVQGEGFPPGRTVEIRLSGVSTEATEHEYVSGTTGTAGEFHLAFTMPAFWPSGDPIVASEVLVVASTPDFVSKATAVFGYGTAASPETPTPLPELRPAVRLSQATQKASAVSSPGEAIDYLRATRDVSTGMEATSAAPRPLSLSASRGVNDQTGAR
jgi:hypothetical protein